MKIENLRHEGVNSMTLEIEGVEFRIIGDDEITLDDAQSGIPSSLANVDTINDIRENLAYSGLRLIVANLVLTPELLALRAAYQAAEAAADAAADEITADAACRAAKAAFYKAAESAV